MEAQLQHTLIRDTHQFGGSKKSSMEEKAPPGIEKKKPPCECFIRLSQCCQSQHTLYFRIPWEQVCSSHTQCNHLAQILGQVCGKLRCPMSHGNPWCSLASQREDAQERCFWEAAARNNNHGVQADHTQRPKHPSVVRGQVQYRGRGFASL